jgi:hypothetical protein
MFELIALFFLLAGLAGMGVILFRKVPLLVDLPETTVSPFDWQGFFSNVRIRTLPAIENFFEKASSLPIIKKLISKIKESSWLKSLTERAKKSDLVNKIKETSFIKKLTPSKDFSPEIFLQKILSKIRVLVLKIDHKTSTWLQALRERAKKRTFLKKDDYWKKLKKITKK